MDVAILILHAVVIQQDKFIYEKSSTLQKSKYSSNTIYSVAFPFSLIDCFHST